MSPQLVWLGARLNKLLADSSSGVTANNTPRRYTLAHNRARIYEDVITNYCPLAYDAPLSDRDAIADTHTTLFQGLRRFASIQIDRVKISISDTGILYQKIITYTYFKLR